MEKTKPFAISISDNHEEEWHYYDTEIEANDAFNEFKETEDDIHLLKLDDEFGYVVINSYWNEENAY